MTNDKFDEFRKHYNMGMITEVILGNVMVGNFTLHDAYSIADLIRSHMPKENLQKTEDILGSYTRTLT